MPFAPGQIVKHVRDKSANKPISFYLPEWRSVGVWPTEGHVYTIKTINHWPLGELVTLVECDNSHLTTNGYEPGFNARHFVPIDDKALDIFRQVLTDAPKDVETV